jgi:hypothetical protein
MPVMEAMPVMQAMPHASDWEEELTPTPWITLFFICPAQTINAQFFISLTDNEQYFCLITSSLSSWVDTHTT